MKNTNGTAPRAAPYSAPCCSRGPRTAPRAVRIHDYSAPCCSHGHFEAVRTAPRAVLISITRRSPFSFVPLHRCGAVASPLLLLTLCALPALHVVHHLRPLHPMHVVHQCTTFTTADRTHRDPRSGRTHAPRGEGNNFSPSPSDTGHPVVFLHRQFRKSIFSGGATWP